MLSRLKAQQRPVIPSAIAAFENHKVYEGRLRRLSHTISVEVVDFAMVRHCCLKSYLLLAY